LIDPEEKLIRNVKRRALRCSFSPRDGPFIQVSELSVDMGQENVLRFPQC